MNQQTPFRQLPETGYLRLYQIVKIPNSKYQDPPLLPICRTSFLEGIREGKYPKPIKLGRVSLWKVEAIRELLENIGSAA